MQRRAAHVHGVGRLVPLGRRTGRRGGRATLVRVNPEPPRRLASATTAAPSSRTAGTRVPQPTSTTHRLSERSAASAASTSSSHA